jgi:hypothetical protein
MAVPSTSRLIAMAAHVKPKSVRHWLALHAWTRNNQGDYPRIMRRALTIYLALYYVLIAGAVMTAWRSGLIAHLDRTWTFVAIAFAVALGGLLAALSRA